MVIMVIFIMVVNVFIKYYNILLNIIFYKIFCPELNDNKNGGLN